MSNLMEIEAIAVGIAKLTLKPGDILVIRFPREMNVRSIEAFLPLLKNELKTKLPNGVSSLLLHGDIELTVVGKDDAPNTQ